MKKFLVILLTFLVMTSLFGIPTFAADDAEEAPAANVVMRVSGLKQDGTSVVIRDVENHNNDHGAMAEGWELAVDCADDDYLDDNGYDRIVVTFYADWKANSDGEFGEGSLDGFRQSTIFVPSDTKITVNLNGHTIDRGLGDNNEFDGEVICIDDDADVMIENGTITGGNSDNGAGGIHIYDHSNVTLNNLTVKGNKTDDDDGAGIYIDCDSIVTLNNVNVTGNIANNGSGSGIAVYNGATLIMNGGSLSNNEAYDGLYCGALFVEDAEAILNNVTISGNKSNRTVVVYVVEHNGTATATFNNCIIENNSSTAKEGRFSEFFSVDDGSLYINGGEIKNNGQTNVIEAVFYCGLQQFVAYLECCIVPAVEGVYTCLVHIETNCFVLCGEETCQWQAYVAQSYNADFICVHTVVCGLFVGCIIVLAVCRCACCAANCLLWIVKLVFVLVVYNFVAA